MGGRLKTPHVFMRGGRMLRNLCLVCRRADGALVFSHVQLHCLPLRSLLQDGPAASSCALAIGQLILSLVLVATAAHTGAYWAIRLPLGGNCILP